MKESKRYLVIARLGGLSYETWLLAGSEELAVRKFKLSLALARKDTRWLDAEYSVEKVEPLLQSLLYRLRCWR